MLWEAQSSKLGEVYIRDFLVTQHSFGQVNGEENRPGESKAHKIWHISMKAIMQFIKIMEIAYLLRNVIP